MILHAVVASSSSHPATSSYLVIDSLILPVSEKRWPPTEKRMTLRAKNVNYVLKNVGVGLKAGIVCCFKEEFFKV